MKADFAPIRHALERARITMEEAGELLPVTKQTLYNWRKGGAARSQFVYTQTCNKAKLIDRAVDLDILPLPDEPMGRKERIKALNTALSQAYAMIKTGAK